LVVCLLAPARAGQQAAPDELTVKARALIDALARDDFASAVKDFDETMRKLSDADKLAAFWKQVPAQLGAFKRRTHDRRVREDPFDVVLVTCEFAKVTLDAKVIFDKDGRIAGFFFVPSLPPAEYKPPAYADPSLFEETEVTVGAEGWPLPGTLTLPKGPGPFPGLVLVHGSGPNDRDETIGPHKPFRDLAWGLASRGIAVLRYEKRTKIYGTRFLAEPGLLASLTVREEVIDDALAAFAVLRSTPRIAADRVFILGHSLGGMLIPRIALSPGAETAAGFIIMAGLTRPVEDTMIQQMTYLFGLDGSLSDDDKAKLAELKRQAEQIKALTEADVGKEERLMNAAPAYWLDLRDDRPAEAVRKVVKPLLVLQGSRDYQVTMEDFNAWKTALAGRSDVEFKLYPRLNHLFSEGKGLPTPAEYTQMAGNVAPYVIEDIAAWIKR